MVVVSVRKTHWRAHDIWQPLCAPTSMCIMSIRLNTFKWLFSIHLARSLSRSRSHRCHCILHRVSVCVHAALPPKLCTPENISSQWTRFIISHRVWKLSEWKEPHQIEILTLEFLIEFDDLIKISLASTHERISMRLTLQIGVKRTARMQRQQQQYQRRLW